MIRLCSTVVTGAEWKMAWTGQPVWRWCGKSSTGRRDLPPSEVEGGFGPTEGRGLYPGSFLRIRTWLVSVSLFGVVPTVA